MDPQLAAYFAKHPQTDAQKATLSQTQAIAGQLSSGTPLSTVKSNYSSGNISPTYTAPTPSITPVAAASGYSPAPTSPVPTPYAPNSGLQDLLNSFSQQQQAYSDQQNAAQGQLDAITAKNATLTANAGLGVADVQMQPIADHFVSGQSQGILNNAQAKIAANNSTAIPLQTQLARIQAQKQSALDAGKVLIGANTPTTQFGVLTNPVTGQAVSPGAVGQIQGTVQNLAQAVANGQINYSDALSQLSQYGPVNQNSLLPTIQKINPQFSVNASNASAGTTAMGQQIKTAADSTNKALDTLASSFNSLSGFQTGGIPATNSIANWLAQSFGSAALSQFKTNLADARSQLLGVLNSSGGTPTGNEATANQYLPDNMTKAQFDANIGTAEKPGIVRQLITQKVGSFTSSGNQNGGGSSNPLGI